ncbi:hypothetical protein PSHT_15492 [Puccinia striiformis]|uniref:Uncharacterized protein n=1 Tax=Puccinia striiformis TaxID=27350 RepID=A0A2S4UEN4_9BASI|nr:hypothetical protein PSHT_15492 [Puccinia striiformis]
MWKKFSIDRPIQTSSDYKHGIGYLEEIVGLLLAKQGYYTVPSISSAPLTGSFRYSTKRGLIPLLSKTTVESLKISAANHKTALARPPTHLNHNSWIDMGNNLKIAIGFGPSPPCQQTFGLNVKPPQHQQSRSLTNSFVNSLAGLTVVRDQQFADFISTIQSNSPNLLPSPPSGSDLDVINKKALTSTTKSSSRVQKGNRPFQLPSTNHLPSSNCLVSPGAKQIPVKLEIKKCCSIITNTKISTGDPPPSCSTATTPHRELECLAFGPEQLSSSRKFINHENPPLAIVSEPDNACAIDPTPHSCSSFCSGPGLEYLASVLTVTVTNDELVFSATDGATLKLCDNIDPATVAAIWDIPEDGLDEGNMPSPSAPHSTAPLLAVSSTSPTNPDPAYFTPSPTLTSSSEKPKIYNLAITGLISVINPTEAATKYERLLYKADLANYLEYLKNYHSLQNHLDQPRQIPR